ncbi:MAG: CpXC domain-containing protein [Elusimicrobiota bacterium]
MSTTKLEEIRCPCGEVFEAELHNAINSVDDPELKKALISGEINVVCCPKCNQIFYAEHFVLYHDPGSELIAFVYPTSFSADEKYWRDRMSEDFKKALAALPDNAITYHPIILFGLDSLVGIIREEEEIDDEICVLEYWAENLGLNILHIRPSIARDKKLPRCIPFAPGHSQRAGIIAGLNKILSHNSSLQWFEKLLKIVEHHKDWRIDEKALSKKPARGAAQKTIK